MPLGLNPSSCVESKRFIHYALACQLVSYCYAAKPGCSGSLSLPLGAPFPTSLLILDLQSFLTRPVEA